MLERINQVVYHADIAELLARYPIVIWALLRAGQRPGLDTIDEGRVAFSRIRL